MTDTQSLIDQLAQESVAPAGGYVRSFALPLLAAMALCGIGVSVLLDGAFAKVAMDGMGPLAVKWGFSIALIALCIAALLVLGKPGRPARTALIGVLIPFIPVAAMFAIEVAITGPRVAGATWASCLVAMAVMSPIGFAGAIAAMRALAPVDLHRAGFIAGLFGGAVAMTAYAPFCPELGMGYMVVFYCLPLLAMAGIGWLTGPKLLRW